MRVAYHVLWTWLLAHVVHGLLLNVKGLGFGLLDPVPNLFLAFVGLLFSIPALVLCLITIDTVLRWRTPYWVRLGGWCSVVLLGVAVTFWFMLSILLNTSLSDVLVHGSSGFLSATIAIGIRYKQFVRLCPLYDRWIQIKNRKGKL